MTSVNPTAVQITATANKNLFRFLSNFSKKNIPPTASKIYKIMSVRRAVQKYH